MIRIAYKASTWRTIWSLLKQFVFPLMEEGGINCNGKACWLVIPVRRKIPIISWLRAQTVSIKLLFLNNNNKIPSVSAHSGVVHLVVIRSLAKNSLWNQSLSEWLSRKVDQKSHSPSWDISSFFIQLLREIWDIAALQWKVRECSMAWLSRKWPWSETP